MAATIEVPQHLTALEKANRVRLARAELKRAVEAGEVAVSAVVLRPPWCALTMTVYDLLVEQRRWGRQRAVKLLSAIPVSENKTLGSLTHRQRLELARLLS